MARRVFTVDEGWNLPDEVQVRLVERLAEEIASGTGALGAAFTARFETLFDGAVIPGDPVRYDIGTNLSAPRPVTNKIVEWTYIGTEDQFPTNIRLGDYFNQIDPEPIPFDLPQIPGYSGDYDATTIVGNVADGGSLATYGWPARFGNALAAAAVGGSVTTSPVFDADAFGTAPNIPGVVFPSRSAFQNLTPLSTPASVVIAAAVRFRDTGSLAIETLNTFGSTPIGRYSISRVGATGSQMLQIANADATAFYQSAPGVFTGELSLVAQWTPNAQRLWCNGVLVIEHIESTPVVMPAMASFRIGFASNNSDTGLARAMVDGRVNRFVWAIPLDVNYLTNERVVDITTKLNSLKGV